MKVWPIFDLKPPVYRVRLGMETDMAFEDLRRERRIRVALRGLAGQRVAAVLQPGNVLVVERSPPRTDGTDEAYKTCELRGWIEVLHDAVPSGSLGPNERIVYDELYSSEAPIYRVTEAGWTVINRVQVWSLATFAVATASLVASILSVFVTIASK
jgi:hypothetical protein